MGHQVQKIRRLKGERRGSNMLIRGAPDKLNKEKRGGEIIKQIINTFFLQQGIISQVKIIHHVSSRMNEKRPIPEHIIVHFQILEVREENLNAFRHEIQKRELKWPWYHIVTLEARITYFSKLLIKCKDPFSSISKNFTSFVHFLGSYWNICTTKTKE